MCQVAREKYLHKELAEATMDPVKARKLFDAWEVRAAAWAGDAGPSKSQRFPCEWIREVRCQYQDDEGVSIYFFKVFISRLVLRYYYLLQKSISNLHISTMMNLSIWYLMLESYAFAISKQGSDVHQDSTVKLELVWQIIVTCRLPSWSKFSHSELP